MRNSIVNHPRDEPLIIIHRWQLEFCGGNEVAAALMSFFEYWHNIKLSAKRQNQKANEVAINHGDEPIADTSLFSWHTEKELIDGIQRIAKTGKTLSKGLAFLEDAGVITIHKNPNPKYNFDKTRHFLFHPEAVNEWLGTVYRLSKITLSSSKITSRSSNFTPRSSKNPSAIPEITPEITPESLKASSAKADFSRPVSLLSEEKIKALELKLPVWKEYLADEQKERKRKGVIKFIERKIEIWLLMPHNDDESKFFEILAIEYEADGGKAPPNKFPSLETKRLFNEAADFHNGNFESVIRKAIHKRGKGIAKIVTYISSPEWKKDNSNGRTGTQGPRRGQRGANGNEKGGFQPGNGRTPEMQAKLEAAFAPKPG